jgi:hypothetical protein
MVLRLEKWHFKCSLSRFVQHSDLIHWMSFASLLECVVLHILWSVIFQVWLSMLLLNIKTWFLTSKLSFYFVVGIFSHKLGMQYIFHNWFILIAINGKHFEQNKQSMKCCLGCNSSFFIMSVFHLSYEDRRRFGVIVVLAQSCTNE